MLLGLQALRIRASLSSFKMDQDELSTLTDRSAPDQWSDTGGPGPAAGWFMALLLLSVNEWVSPEAFATRGRVACFYLPVKHNLQLNEHATTTDSRGDATLLDIARNSELIWIGKGLKAISK